MFSIAEEYEKNPELKREDVDHIKEWISKQPHLPNIKDEHIILFLHSCYYKIEATKNTIDNYFTIRTIAPDIFADRNPKSKQVQEALKTMYMVKLPGNTPEGYEVFLSKLIRTEPEYYVLPDLIKTYNMHADIWYKENGTSPGIVYFIDMNGFSLGHVCKLNLNIMKQHLSYLQEGLPLRLKGIHLYNVVSFIDMVMNMMKPFMKPELQRMFHYHQANSEKVYESIPKSMLPKDYGGDAPCLEDLHAETKKFFEDNEEWFREEELQRVDESKRQGKSKLAPDEFNMAGSFKKLSFD